MVSKESKERTFVETIFCARSFHIYHFKITLKCWDDLHCTDRKRKIQRHYLPVVSYNSHKDSEDSYDYSHFSDEETES